MLNKQAKILFSRYVLQHFKHSDLTSDIVQRPNDSYLQQNSFRIEYDFDVIEKVINACEDLKATEMPEADAVIIFSCAGRFIALGPLINEEIEGMRNVATGRIDVVAQGLEHAAATFLG